MKLQRLNSLLIAWTALSSGKRCIGSSGWEKALLKVHSEVVLKHKIHRCGGVSTLFCFFPLTCWCEDSFSHVTYLGCNMYTIPQSFEYFSPFSFCIFQICSWLLGFCWEVFTVLVWVKVPVTSSFYRNDGLLKAKVQPLDLELTCNVPYFILRAVQMLFHKYKLWGRKLKGISIKTL